MLQTSFNDPNEFAVATPAGSLASFDASTLPVAHSLWIGDKLPALAQACLRSMLRVGHKVVLHTYGPVSGVPQGVEIADAEETIPAAEITRHRRTGSYALFSDLFRFRLLERGADMWVDCDIYCLKPIPRAQYLFGWEHKRSINCSVLSLPAGSPLLKDLLQFARKPDIPPWFGPHQKLWFGILRALGWLGGAEDLPWGSIGPAALTYFARLHDKAHLALPAAVLSPIEYFRTQRLLNPSVRLTDIVTDETVCIHLFSHILDRHRSDVPATSPLGQILAS